MDGFNNDNADVVCRQLGFRDGALRADPVTDFKFTPGTSLDIILFNASCVGDENNLIDCSDVRWSGWTCPSNSQAAVFCALPYYEGCFESALASGIADNPQTLDGLVGLCRAFKNAYAGSSQEGGEKNRCGNDLSDFGALVDDSLCTEVCVNDPYQLCGGTGDYRVVYSTRLGSEGFSLTGNSGSLTSYNYPGVYVSNDRQEWTVTLNSTQRVQITFPAFDIGVGDVITVSAGGMNETFTSRRTWISEPVSSFTVWFESASPGNGFILNYDVVLVRPPKMREAPEIVSTTSTTVDLRWNAWAGEDIGDPPLIGYDVFVRKDVDWVRDQRVDQSITSASVGNLTPDTDYSFRVADVREGYHGTGPWSTSVGSSTLCKPSDSPTGVNVAAIKPKELEVSWEHLSLESAKCRSGVTHYMIYYATSGSSSTNSLMVSNDTSSYTITGLETYRDYTIHITASNKDEESDNSIKTIGRSLEEVAPAPISVAMQRSTESSFTVSWSTPLPSNVNGHIQMYIIRFKPSDQGDDGFYRMENVLTDAYEGEHTVMYLASDVNYTVEVQTVNGAGSSNWSNPVKASTSITGYENPVSDVSTAPVGAIVAGVTVPLVIIIIIFLIILNVVFYRRAKLRHPETKPGTMSPRIAARETSQEYENSAFDVSMHACRNTDTYQDLDTDTGNYQNLSDSHTYQDLKNTNIDTSHQSVNQSEPYEYINIEDNSCL